MNNTNKKNTKLENGTQLRWTSGGPLSSSTRLMLQIPKQQRFACKYPGGTTKPSLLLRTQRLNKNFSIA